MSNLIVHKPMDTIQHSPVIDYAAVDFQYLEPLLMQLGYMSPEDVEKVKDAYAVAYIGHDGQKRSSGLPYITHPVEVAGILASLKLDLESIQAGLLHDVVEDTPFTSADLRARFGNEVAQIVDGVTKLDKLKFRTRQEAEVANFRKMIFSMTKDVRVVLIKLADRTHNMRTLGALRPDKQRRIATETVNIYCALAYRLGIMKLKRELDFLSFQALYPFRYKMLERAAYNASKLNHNRVERVVNDIEDALRVHGIEARVVSERIPLLNIYKRMAQKRQKFSSILDIYRFIVITDTPDQCYRALGVVHSLYRPIPGKFTDFIALPKPNGFQTLMTELVTNTGEPVEIFIRTEQMEEVAEYGIATSLTYQPNEVNSEGRKRIQDWLENLAELQHTSVNSSEFNSSVKNELYPEDIFVFSPRGKIIELPAGSTVLDFAYYIHTNVGAKAVHAVVDGKDVPLATELRTGQTVEVVTSEKAEPSETQLLWVRSARARARLRQVLKDGQMETYVAKGRVHLERSLGFSIEAMDAFARDKMLEFFSLKTLEDLFAEICQGNIISPVAQAVYASYLGQETSDVLAQLQGSQLYSELTYDDLLQVGHKVQIDETALVAPDDEIMVTTNNGDGLLVHHVESKVVEQLKLTPYQHIRVRWGIDQIDRTTVQCSLSFALPASAAPADAPEKVNFREQVAHDLVNYLNQTPGLLRSLNNVSNSATTVYANLELYVCNNQELRQLFDSIATLGSETLKLTQATRIYTRHAKTRTEKLFWSRD